jgi:uncharacterized protein (DUF983 family)
MAQVIEFPAPDLILLEPAYLVHACPSCHAEFGRVRADDAAPWLTIIVIGHIFLPLVFFLNLDRLIAFWASVAVYAGFLSLLALAVLPRAKGLFIAILWGPARRAPRRDNQTCKADAGRPPNAQPRQPSVSP